MLPEIQKLNMKKLLFLFSLSIFIFSCQPEEDPLCDDVNCENGGDCLDGTCTCPEMWEGTFCENQKTPITISIESLTLTDFPATNSDGNAWDVDGDARPDLFFNIENPNGSLYRSSTMENRAVSTDWSISDLKISEVDFTRNLTIVLFDEDGSDAEFMTDISFQIYDDSNGFPESISFSGSGGDYQGTLSLSYNY